MAKKNRKESAENGRHGKTATRLSRAKRKRRRARADRGLPPDLTLESLARTYLERQRQHRPELATAGILPEAKNDAIRGMVDDFKRRHRTGIVKQDDIRPFVERGLDLAGNYNRFSCDNSSPLSIEDQMVNALTRANEKNLFVPWSFVFCDYSVSGLDSSRQGYTSYVRVLRENECLVCTIVDDFTRASRDELEWWRLAALHKRHRKGMLGASDGFDLSSPDWDVKVTIAGLVSRLFIRSLQQKVRRGMRGAASRGTSIGKPSLGFTRRVKLDENGTSVCGADGQPKHELCIDPETAEFRRMMFDMFVTENKSAYRICQQFNELSVDDWDGWTESGIKKLLKSPSAIGIFIWNQTTREYDWEEQKWVKVKNPRDQWEVYRDCELAIVPMDQWKAARRKLAAARRKSPLTGKKLSRNQRSATTLFSGTLHCEHCGSELLLYRSTGKYKSMFCHNGRGGAHGCQLSTSKSTRIIERCLLGFIREHFLDENALRKVLKRANEYLAKEAKKPKTDTAPLKAKVKALQSKVDKLVRRIESTDNEALCEGYDRRIAQHQRHVDSLREEIRDADSQNVEPPSPLDLEMVKAYVADLDALLNQSIPAAAEVLRMLTGPITIRREKIPGRKRGARWIARFSPDLMRLLHKIASNGDYPDCITLEYLSHAIWIKPKSVKVVIEDVPKYEQLAPKFKQLHQNGASIRTIASAHGMCWSYAKEILDFADTGVRPQWKGTKKSGRRTGVTPLYQRIAADVSRLRDKRNLSFPKIVDWLLENRGTSVSVDTACRAWDFAHRETIRRAAERGQVPERRPNRPRRAEKTVRMRTMVKNQRTDQS